MFYFSWLGFEYTSETGMKILLDWDHVFNIGANHNEIKQYDGMFDIVRAIKLLYFL